MDDTLAAPGAWCPVSLVPFPDGSVGRFPHIIERNKPGIIGVLADGRRFCNEGNGYHDYVAAMLRAVPPGQEVASWLVCTRAFQRRYGLGIARPTPLPVGPYIRSGYIKAGRTIAELARACGIDPAGLERTIAEYNRHARKGEDPVFGRGSTPYNRLRGRSRQPAQPLRRADRARAVLRRQGGPRQLRHLRRTEDGRQRPRAGRARRADPGALCGRHRHGERHGRPLPGRRHQSRPGDDLRLHRRPARRGRHRL